MEGDKTMAKTKEKKCEWFVLCDNAAVATEPHPILGAVPICQRCADMLVRLKG